MAKDFLASNWKEFIPNPVFEENSGYNELYYKAWELARDHVREVSGMPQNPYMDEAFCDTQIWIWDTCLMTQFCKFANTVFPGIESLNNFYEVLYGDKKLPKILTSMDEPFWTGAIPGEMNDIVIHIADNPPLFAWAEYENAVIEGNIKHVKELLYEKEYLQKHYDWLESLRKPEKLSSVLNVTNFIKEKIGYRWEGGCSGMDNAPRGRLKVKDGKERPNNPNMLWVDAICLQALSAKYIAKLFELVGDVSAASKWNEKYNEKKEIVNRYYWDDKDKFYYDIDINTKEFYKVKTISSFWALISGLASKEQAKSMVGLVLDDKEFGGEIPLISLARSDGDYCPDGRYARGSLWLNTSYMALKGIVNYGFFEEGRTTAKKILNHMLKTYKQYEPHTIWECYSPEQATPASNETGEKIVRPNFCGWSALGPISMYIEFVLGFYSINAFERTVKWSVPKQASGEIGIKNLRFGDVVTDIILNGKECIVKSSGEYTLVADGVEYKIQKGQTKFVL